ncbi:hypothetical protein BJ875DRAFT_383991, partial [Amylocarpus encephaloides]
TLSYISRMLATGSYSDNTISCSGPIFRAHRAVVCLQAEQHQVVIAGNSANMQRPSHP